MRKAFLAFILLVSALAAVPAEAAPGAGEFVVRCKYSHTLPDDPIVYPGKPGASHLHDFFGNETADAYSTVESLLAGTTTCRVPSDTAGYWAPVGYLNGKQLKPLVMRIYYLGVKDVRVETIPAGLQVIGGNKMATSPTENPHVRWSCGRTTTVITPLMDHPYDCTPWTNYRFVDGIVGLVEMPSCWDGVGLKPEDVTYPEDGRCPREFPHALPRLSQRVHYGIMNPLNPDGSVAFSLASGAYYTMHADFWNTWQQARLDQLVAECLDAHVHCGAAGSAPEIDWSREFGTSRYDLVFGLAANETGVYAAGFTNYELEAQTYQRGSDVFVRRYRPNGRDLWTQQFGTLGIDQGRAVAADDTGVYVAGTTEGTFHKQFSSGGVDAFVAKFDLDGRQVWIHQFGTLGTDQALGIAVDATGVYVGGSTDGSLGAPNLGGIDGFVRKYTADGIEAWTRQFGTSGTDEVHAIAVHAGQAYAAGSTDGSLVGQPHRGGLDAFVRVYGSGGTRLWTYQFGSTGDDDARGITAGSGGVYVGGSTDGSLTSQNIGGIDGFVRRFSLRGADIWTRQFGTPGDDQVRAMALRSSGVYVAGSTDGALPDQSLLGETDAFLRRYSVKGFEDWTRQFGTPDYDAGLAATVDATGAYVGGETHGAFEGQINAGDRDAFVTKLMFT